MDTTTFEVGILSLFAKQNLAAIMPPLVFFEFVNPHYYDLLIQASIYEWEQLKNAICTSW